MTTPGPYSGLRVLDFTHGFAGPYCTRLLADMGAEVVKVEPPHGDMARYFPHYIAPTESGFFTQVNLGKKSVILDLKRPEAQDIALRLAETCDVVVENFRPGVMDTLQLGYRHFQTVNNRLIMVSISAYGQTGPYATRPGAEITAQALSGVMDMTGASDGPPTLVGVGVADVGGGTHAVAAIGAALYCRDRRGVGQHIDISLLDCLLESQIMAFQEYFLSDGKVSQTRSGNTHPTFAPFGVFRGRDGYVTLAAVDDARWQRLCDAMGRPDLATDPRYLSASERQLRRSEVNNLVEAWVATCPSVVDCADRLAEAKVPCAPVLGVGGVVKDPHIAARAMFVEVEHPTAGSMSVMNTPLRFSATPTSVAGSPLLGQHTEDVLKSSLALGSADVEALAAQGVVARPQDLATGDQVPRGGWQ